ncbi:MAG: DNA-binding transcriptional regulator, MarR family [Sporanaerobacter sp.]|jgi:MarR family transcriptional regulator, organic hydroperoxide resistance regulator|uniref:MarR family winged helix-turn-helix transcriptional regulator n=1 Tax=Sporanaerobacter sp. TaxID=2010183 RepID=UPI003A0FFAA3
MQNISIQNKLKGGIKISSTDEGIIIASFIKEVYFKLNNSIKKKFEDIGLTVPQITIMSMLYKNGNMKVSDISEEMYITNGTVSGIIDRLEKQKLVCRTRSKKDRRVVYIALTEEGYNIAKGFRNVIDDYFHDLFSNSSKEELETIITGLQILKSIVDR